MFMTGETKNGRPLTRITMAAIVATLIVGGMLIAGGPPAKAYKLKHVLITSYLEIPDIEGESPKTKLHGLVVARQTGNTSKKGTRPMGIIAILIGLKADQDYGLAFSTRRCGRGAGGLVGKGIRFTASSEGEAVVKRNYRLRRKVLRKARSVVVLSPETGRRFQSCGPIRVAVGDVSGDGTSEIVTN